ncbi:prephenate dehydrogenase/arogenate dehydrogenase family protein [Patescibacteria group bacterium]|nr:prephenate dehydrogenase/arogenate dehydrogenase family protein [Patescibacteria group bacterium]
MKTKQKTPKPLIGIIGGNGKMGMWFKKFFENLGFEILISGTRTTLTNIELAKKADIVIVSVPIQKTIEVIKEVRKNVKKNALL